MAVGVTHPLFCAKVTFVAKIPKNFGVVFEQAAYGIFSCSETQESETLLRSLRDVLCTVVPPCDDPSEKAPKDQIMYFLAKDSGPWASAGVSEEDAVVWQSFNFSPVGAKVWVESRVAAPLAFLFECSGLSATNYAKIMNFYEVDKTNADKRGAFQREVLDVFADGSLTAAQAMRWIDIGVRLDDARALRWRGLTPGKTKALLAEGFPLENILLSRDEVEIPGTSYRKILEFVKSNGWNARCEVGQRGTKANYYSVLLEKNGSRAALTFSPTGRICYPVKVEVGHRTKFYRPKGVKGLIRLLKMIEA